MQHGDSCNAFNEGIFIQAIFLSFDGQDMCKTHVLGFSTWGTYLSGYVMLLMS